MSTATEPTLLDRLRENREKLADELEGKIDAREQAIAEFDERQNAEKTEDRPSDSDVDAFRQAGEEYRDETKALEAELRELDERIEQQTMKAERRKTAADNSPDVKIDSEPAVYRSDNAHEVSWLKDLLITEPSWKGKITRDWGKAGERLERHGREIEDQMPKIVAEKKRRAEEQIEQAEREFRGSFKTRTNLDRMVMENPFERNHWSAGQESRANPSRLPGAGGEFVPPLWLISEFLKYLRAGRVIAPQLRNLELPPGTDVIKLPKVKLGAEVAPQLSDNAAVASRDITTTFVEAPIKTLAGQEDVAIQVIEQSPGQIFDRVVMEDLIADYNLRLDREVSFGAGTESSSLNAGIIKGLYPAANWEGVTNEATEGKQVASAYLAAMFSNWSQIARTRFNTEEIKHFMNPRRAAFLAAQLDGEEGKSGRPIVNAVDFPNFNIAGELPDDPPAEGFMFRTPLGPPVYGTANIHTEDNGKGAKVAGQTNDYLLTVKADDCWFFEGNLRTRVLPEVASGTLQVRYQVYNYIGLLVRYGPSIAIAVGTPFQTPKMAAGAVSGNWTF